MGVVDYEFYSTVYMGNDADAVSFPALCARASDVIGAMTKWAVDCNTITKLPARLQTLYKKAVCAQVDFFAVNGLDSVSENGMTGFTVGKVSVHGTQKATGGGAASESVASLAYMYLEQTGLMNPQVDTADVSGFYGWW